MTDDILRQSLAKALAEAGVPRDRLDQFYSDHARHYVKDGRYTDTPGTPGALVGNDERNPSRVVAILCNAYPELFVDGESLPSSPVEKSQFSNVTALCIALNKEAAQTRKVYIPDGLDPEGLTYRILKEKQASLNNF